jgi:hypothetical protein
MSFKHDGTPFLIDPVLLALHDDNLGFDNSSCSQRNHFPLNSQKLMDNLSYRANLHGYVTLPQVP